MGARLRPGLLFMAQSAFWFSLMSLLVKTAGRRLSSMEVVFVRGVVTLVLSYAMLRRAGVAPWGAPAHRRMLLVRGLLGSLALLCFYFSIIHLPLAAATVIQYTNPVLATLLAAWLLREHAGWREIAAVVAGLAGVALVARPPWLFGGAAASAVNPLHALVGLCGALCSALAYVAIRQMGKAEHPLVVVFYFPLVTVPLALPLAIPGWLWPTPAEWATLVGIGVCTQLAQVSMTRGLQLEPAGRATAVGYLQIVFAAVWGALAFGERPSAWTVAGAAVILAGTLLVAVRGRGSEAAARAAEAE